LKEIPVDPGIIAALQLVKNGGTCAAAARQYNVSVFRLTRAAYRLGLRLRKRGGDQWKNRSRSARALILILEQGKSGSAAAKETGLSRQAVSMALKRFRRKEAEADLRTRLEDGIRSWEVRLRNL
jgi:molybdenum-dependent DNA-binding transcriptional regulator ModE